MKEAIKQLTTIIDTFKLNNFGFEIRFTEEEELELHAILDEATILAQEGESKHVHFEEGKVTVRNISLPTPESPTLEATVQLNQIRIHFLHPLFEALAKFTKQDIASKLDTIFDELLIHNIQVHIKKTLDNILDLRLYIDEVMVMQQGSPQVYVRGADIQVLHLDLNEEDSNKRLAQSKTVIHKLEIQLNESLFTQISSFALGLGIKELVALNIKLPGHIMVVSGKVKKIMTLPFQVDIALSEDNNKFVVALDNIHASIITLPGFIHSFINYIVSKYQHKSKGLLEVHNNKYYIDPVAASPGELIYNLDAFSIQDGNIIIRFTPTPEMHKTVSQEIKTLSTTPSENDEQEVYTEEAEEQESDNLAQELGSVDT